MTSISSDNKFSRLALPVGKIKIPHFLYVLIIVLSSLVLIVGAVNIYLQNQKRVSVKKSKVVSTPLDLKLVVAKKTLGWINDQRDERGVYIQARNCALTGVHECLSPNKSNRTGSAPMWAFANYYMKTKDERYLKILKNDLEKYTNKETVNVIQTSSLNCKILQSFADSSYLTAEDKVKLKNMCFDSEYEDGLDSADYLRVSRAELDEVKLKKEINANMLSFIEGKNEINNGTSEYLNKYKLFVYKYGIFSSEFAARYTWKKDGLDLKRMYFYENLAIANLVKNYNQLNLTDKCTVGGAILDDYQISRNENSLDLAKLIFDQNIKKNVYKMYIKNIEESNSCILFVDQLYNITKEKEYLSVKNEYINDAILNNFDIDGLSGFITGEGGFYTKSGETFKKDIILNGILVGILSET